MADENKTKRILKIYTMLMDGKILNKANLAKELGANERTIQRDIDDIRNFLDNEAEENGFINSVYYDRMQKGYRLEQIYKIRSEGGYRWNSCFDFIITLCNIKIYLRVF